MKINFFDFTEQKKAAAMLAGGFSCLKFICMIKTKQKIWFLDKIYKIGHCDMVLLSDPAVHCSVGSNRLSQSGILRLCLNMTKMNRTQKRYVKHNVKNLPIALEIFIWKLWVYKKQESTYQRLQQGHNPTLSRRAHIMRLKCQSFLFWRFSSNFSKTMQGPGHSVWNWS